MKSTLQHNLVVTSIQRCDKGLVLNQCVQRMYLPVLHPYIERGNGGRGGGGRCSMSWPPGLGACDLPRLAMVASSIESLWRRQSKEREGGRQQGGRLRDKGGRWGVRVEKVQRGYKLLYTGWGMDNRRVLKSFTPPGGTFFLPSPCMCLLAVWPKLSSGLQQQSFTNVIFRYFTWNNTLRDQFFWVYTICIPSCNPIFYG